MHTYVCGHAQACVHMCTRVWHVCARVCMCMCVDAYCTHVACVCVGVHVHTCVHTRVMCVRAGVHVCTLCVHVHACTHVHMSALVCVLCTCMCACVHVYGMRLFRCVCVHACTCCVCTSCMCMYICACTCVHVYGMCLCRCACAHACVCMQVCMCAHAVCASTCACMCACVHWCVYSARACVRVCMCGATPASQAHPRPLLLEPESGLALDPCGEHGGRGWGPGSRARREVWRGAFATHRAAPSRHKRGLLRQPLSSHPFGHPLPGQPPSRWVSAPLTWPVPSHAARMARRAAGLR